MSNRELEEKYEEERIKIIASITKISIDDVQKISFDISENTSNEGHLYGFSITFEGSKEILNKIQGLDDSNTISVGPDAFN